MPLPKAPTKMGEIIKGESKRKTQIRKKLEKESSDASKTSKQKKVDVNKLVSLAKKPIKKPEMPLAADKETVGKLTGKTKLFVLDTNVLMHDQPVCSDFEARRLYPFGYSRELDLHKTGMSEVSRNVDKLRGDRLFDKNYSKNDPPKFTRASL